MTSNSMICMLFFTVGFILLIGSIHTMVVHNNDESTNQGLDYNHANPDDYFSIMMGKRQMASRGIRLPSESILLGKRRIPNEAVLLGRRYLPNEAVLLGKRR